MSQAIPGSLGNGISSVWCTAEMPFTLTNRLTDNMTDLRLDIFRSVLSHRWANCHSRATTALLVVSILMSLHRHDSVLFIRVEEISKSVAHNDWWVNIAKLRPLIQGHHRFCKGLSMVMYSPPRIAHRRKACSPRWWFKFLIMRIWQHLMLK